MLLNTAGRQLLAGMCGEEDLLARALPSWEEEEAKPRAGADDPVGLWRVGGVVAGSVAFGCRLCAEQTAIQSPNGGTKITWGGPPLMPDPGKDLHLDLAPEDDHQAVVERLLSLGAKRLESAHGGDGAVLIADPIGNESGVLTHR